MRLTDSNMQPLAREIFDVFSSLQLLSANDSQASLSLSLSISFSVSRSLERYKDLTIYLPFIVV
jgi:hypothetical protein